MISHQPLSGSKVERVGRIESYMPNYICRRHGGLSQWDRSNRLRIRSGTVKSLHAPRELSLLALRQDYAKKIDPCRMLVWLGRRTVP